MEDIWKIVLAGVVGYAGHWVQQAVTRRFQHKQEQDELIKRMRDKVQELRLLPRDQARDEAPALLTDLHKDAELLRKKKLRKRIIDDVTRVGTWRLFFNEATETEIREAFARDALACLTAAARGEHRLPAESSEKATLLYLLENRLNNTWKTRISPETRALVDQLMDNQLLRQVELWRKHRAPLWRRVTGRWR